MDIRNFMIDDYDEIYQLWINTPGMGLNNLDDSRVGIEKYLCRNPATCFVASEGEAIVGTILAGHDGRRGYIYHLTVATSHERRGIASALVDASLAALKNEGISKAGLVVFGDNERGNTFWEKLGFTTRLDLTYRNKALVEMVRFDP